MKKNIIKMFPVTLSSFSFKGLGQVEVQLVVLLL